MQPLIEDTVLKLAENDEGLMREFLTNYSVSTGEAHFRRWRKLAEEIITKHNDGWVMEPGKSPQGVGYPEQWLRRVVKERPRQYVIEGGMNH
jgi:dipeptidase